MGQIEPPGTAGFSPCFPFTRVPVWVPIFDPQPRVGGVPTEKFCAGKRLLLAGQLGADSTSSTAGGPGLICFALRAKRRRRCQWKEFVGYFLTGFHQIPKGSHSLSSWTLSLLERPC